jgi:heme A synthase
MLSRRQGEPDVFTRNRTARSSRWVAIAAAYLLVLQAVFVGLASGAHAAGMSLDRSLAMTLCAPGDMQQGGHSDQGTPPHDQMTCCMSGCASSGSVAPAADGAYLPVIHRVLDLIAFARHLDAPHGYVAGRSPANPRAPPSLV